MNSKNIERFSSVILFCSMLASDLEKSLGQMLRSNGAQLKSMAARDVLHFATEHWCSTEIDGLRPTQGDGLVAYFELINRGRGALFEFGVNRILRMPPQDETKFWEWAPCFKLRLSVAFQPTLEVFQIKSVTSVFACWEKGLVSPFISQVESSPQLELVSQLPIHSSGINFCECVGPPGEANHAKNGLTWAIA